MQPRLSRSHWYIRTVLAIAALTALIPTSARAEGPLAYPKTRTVDQVDVIHDVRVPDPYRWLEDDNAEETKAWVKAENKVTFGYLEQIPERNQIKKRLTRLWNYEKYTTPFKQGGRYFYRKNDGLQNQYVVYTMDSLGGKPRVLLDPNKLSKDGTIALSTWTISDDGKLMAYGLSDGGSDWQTFHVRDVETGKDLADKLEWIKFSGASWSKDSKGFFYSRYDKPKPGEELSSTNYYNKLYYHRVGAQQSEDTLVYERPDQKEWGFSGFQSEDGRFLLLSISQGTERKNRLYYRDLREAHGDFVKLLDDFDAQYSFLENDGPVFYIKTDLNAPRGRVIAIDTTNPDPANWKELIPQVAETLRGVGVVNNMFVASYLKDAHTRVKIFNLKGSFVREVEFPGLGSAGGFSGKRTYTETFYSYNSFANPPTIYRYDMKTGKSSVFKRAKVDFNPDQYVTTQVFYKSKDGTQIPMFITHQKGLKKDGNNPCYLYGYGGFDISLTPRFSISNLVWMEMGGIYAQANLRGGGEYGKQWHDAGRLLNKQNVFDDFIAAAEWLVSNKFTRREKLAIGGGSNGGLLVGACITQRPDLYGAALPAVGVMDMLRFQKFTIGWAWTSDYGRIEDPEMFKTLYAYSPYHNIKKGTVYPPTLVTTGDHDDRVVPAHSFKFAAALQAAQSGPAPILIRIETRAGHGAGKPTEYVIDETADKWAFLVRNLGMEGPKL
ncbi:MAG: prolyl oligopeptidase family protein [Phycisphaerae bacterium]